MLCLECLATICPAFGASQIFMSKTKNETPCHIFFFLHVWAWNILRAASKILFQLQAPGSTQYSLM